MQAFCWNKCILDIRIYNACTIIACTVLARLGASWQRKSKRVLYFREGITSPFTGCRDPPFQGITLLQPFVIVATEEINFFITISKGVLVNKSFKFPTLLSLYIAVSSPIQVCWREYRLARTQCVEGMPLFYYLFYV